MDKKVKNAFRSLWLGCIYFYIMFFCSIVLAVYNLTVFAAFNFTLAFILFCVFTILSLYNISNIMTSTRHIYIIYKNKELFKNKLAETDDIKMAMVNFYVELIKQKRE